MGGRVGATFKRKNIFDLMSAFLNNNILPKRGCSYRKEITHTGNKFLDLKLGAPVAQWVKRWPADLAVLGSSPN